MIFNNTHRQKGFTLIELLVVLGVVAAVSVIVFLILNPAELLRKGRDSGRIYDLRTINSALSLYQLEFSSGFGSASTVYVSLPDPAATSTEPTDCASFILPPLPNGSRYSCATPSTYRKVDGNGWMPVDFLAISIGSPFAVLPIDPINKPENGLYYTYIPGGSWELTAKMESGVYGTGGAKDVVTKDSGDSNFRYEIGTNLLLTPDIGDGSPNIASTTPPTRSSGLPTGTLAAGTTFTSLSLATDKVATCKYATTAGASYAAMATTFSVTSSTAHSTNVSGLVNGNTYNYYVRCQDAASNPNTSDYTIAFSVASATDTTPPTVPAGLTATATSTSQINLSWTASTDNISVAGYKVFRGGSQIATSTLTTFSNTGLTASTTYSYNVSAYDAAGNNSAQSAAANATTYPPAITIGETNILALQAIASANFMFAQSATLSQTATIQSLSYYSVTASGNLRLGIYDATGPGGGPGAKRAETNEITLVAGWNTANVITPVSLPADTYWLAFIFSGSPEYRYETTGSFKLFAYTYNVMPATFSTTPTSVSQHLPVYATLSL